MNKFYQITLLVLCFSCNGRDATSRSIKGDSTIKLNENKKDTLSKESRKNIVEDTVTTEEMAVLETISHENEFLILSKNVERYYSPDHTLIFSRLSFSKERLIEKGYVFYELKFYGSISDMNINYRYSLGQASYGYGSITGNDPKNYLHTLKSCGVTACVTQVFQNGKKIFESIK